MAAGKTYEPIATQTLSSTQTSITFSSIPQTYTDLVLVCSVQVTAATDDFNIWFNGDTGNNFSRTQLAGNGSISFSSRTTNESRFRIADYMPNSTLFGTIVANIQNYSNSTTYKTCLLRQSNAADLVNAQASLWRNTNAITSIVIKQSGAGYFNAGSTFTLYGITAA
jgi:low temperature requirement protein LtrA